MGLFDWGKSDKASNKGQVDPKKFETDKERKDYQAGWNKQKEEEARKKK